MSVEYHTVYKTVNGKMISTIEELTPFIDYDLIYDDGSESCVSIRLRFKDASKHYLKQSFGYWCGLTQTEKRRTVISIKEHKEL